MSDQYTRLFQNAGSMLYNNVSYYATKIQEIIVEISLIGDDKIKFSKFNFDLP